MKVTLNITGELEKRFKAVLGATKPEDVLDKLVRKIVVDAETQRFAAAKQAEVEAEARRLTEEMAQA